jgi:hypothetical protein
MSASFITQLNEDNGRLHKEDVIKQALTAAKLGNTVSTNFLQGLKFCYNPYVTFGVKQIPESIGIVDAENPYDEFFELLGSLWRRELTGHDARDAIAEMSERFDSEEWNLFLAPILRRDMRSGISSTTVNKICKGTDWEIPIFSCQLATNSEGRPEMKGTKRLEPKLDGVRVLMLVSMLDSGIYATCYSRNGKVFENEDNDNEDDGIDDIVNKYDDQESGKYTQNMDDVESGIIPEEFYDDVSVARNNAKHQYDFNQDTIEYVGGEEEWNKLTQDEKDSVIDSMERDWDRNRSLGESDNEEINQELNETINRLKQIINH